jgi:hypothetical protein
MRRLREFENSKNRANRRNANKHAACSRKVWKIDLLLFVFI